MYKRFSGFIVISLFMFQLVSASEAQMQSEHYRIPTSVMSGGGPMDSSSGAYHLNGTVGQPTPLMHAADPPYSLSYHLYPGFWYTLDAVFGVCVWDIEPAFGDGDVDGSDLAAFTASDQVGDPASFAEEFGRADCFQSP